MDPFRPIPPIELAVYIFQAFTRLYYSTFDPIDFNGQLQTEQLITLYKIHSIQARQVLVQLYTLFKPLVSKTPIQQRMLEQTFLYSISLIHTKFGTTPIQPSGPPPTAPIFQHGP